MVPETSGPVSRTKLLWKIAVWSAWSSVSWDVEGSGGRHRS